MSEEAAEAGGQPEGGAGDVGQPNPGAASAGAQPEGGAGGGEGSWVDNLPEDVRGYVQQKGFEDPSTLAQSYRDLEKLMGAPQDQLLRLPKEDDTEGWQEVFNRLGRPKEPDGYQLERAEGAPEDENFEQFMKHTAHELGLTPEQLNGLVQRLDGQVKEHQASQQQQREYDAAEVDRQLRAEWGAAADEKFNRVDQIADSLGFTEEQLAGLRDAMGPVEAMKFVDSLGEKMGEDQLVDGGQGGRGKSQLGSLPPDAAKQEIEQLRRDPNFAKRVQDGDADAKRRWDQLHEWAYPS